MTIMFWNKLRWNPSVAPANGVVCCVGSLLRCHWKRRGSGIGTDHGSGLTRPSVPFALPHGRYPPRQSRCYPLGCVTPQWKCYPPPPPPLPRVVDGDGGSEVPWPFWDKSLVLFSLNLMFLRAETGFAHWTTKQGWGWGIIRQNTRHESEKTDFVFVSFPTLSFSEVSSLPTLNKLKRKIWHDVGRKSVKRVTNYVLALLVVCFATCVKATSLHFHDSFWMPEARSSIPCCIYQDWFGAVSCVMVSQLILLSATNSCRR